MGIARSSAWFSLGTLTSRLSGIARDAVLAGVFGAGMAMDAFIIAFRIPNLLRDLLAEGALSSSFTKVYASRMQSDPQAARSFLDEALRFALIASLGITILGMVLAPWIVDLMTVGAQVRHSPEHHQALREQTVFLSRLLFWFLPTVVVGSVVMGALHQHGNFFVSGVSSLALNTGFIAGALLIGPALLKGTSPEWWKGLDPMIFGLCLGVLAGGVATLCFEWFFLRKSLRKVPSPHTTPSSSRDKQLGSPELKEMLALMLPAAIAAGAGPIGVIINTNFASSLEEGAVTWLNYAFRILQVPVGVIGVAIASAALPALSRAAAEHQLDPQKNPGKLSSMIKDASGLAIWLMLPAALIIGIESQGFISLFFGHFRFSPSDVSATAMALSAYAFALVPYGLIKVFTSYYFSIGQTSFAMRATFAGVGLNIIANMLMIRHMGHVGLALATSLSLATNALILFWGTQKRGINWWDRRMAVNLGALVLAGTVALGISWGRKSFFVVQSHIIDLPKVSDGLEIVITTVIVAMVFLLISAGVHQKPLWMHLKRRSPIA